MRLPWTSTPSSRSFLLKRSTYVHRRNAHQVSQLLLDQWQLDHSHRPTPPSEPRQQLAKDVGHLLGSVALAHADEPLPKRSFVNQRGPPESRVICGLAVLDQLDFACRS